MPIAHCDPIYGRTSENVFFKLTSTLIEYGHPINICRIYTLLKLHPHLVGSSLISQFKSDLRFGREEFYLYQKIK